MKTNPHSLTLSLSVQHKSFYRKLARSLQLDTGTAEILSGEFAEEAILVKTDQLTRHEVRVCVCVCTFVCACLHVTCLILPCSSSPQTQALAERQSAVYSLQRKLKACRQALESKELHLGLLQKKVAALEERLQMCSHREADWETTTEKVRLATFLPRSSQLRQSCQCVRCSLCVTGKENGETIEAGA